jgi:hypothetical protein
VRPEDREDLFRRGMEALLSGDTDKALGYYSPDIEAGAADWMSVGIFKGSQIEVDEEVGYVVEIDDEGLASYLEITRGEERALELAHAREVSN